MPDLDTCPHCGGGELSKRLADLERSNKLLVETLLRPDTPKAVADAGLKRGVLMPGNADTALRARVGRAARRAGIPYKRWVAMYGMVDCAPTTEPDDPRQSHLFADGS